MITKTRIVISHVAYSDSLYVYINDRKYLPDTASVARIARLVEGKEAKVEFGTRGLLVRYEFEQDKTVQRMLYQPIAEKRLYTLCKLAQADTLSFVHVHANERFLDIKDYVVNFEYVPGIKQKPSYFRIYCEPDFIEWELPHYYTVADALKSIQDRMRNWDGYITAYHWVMQLMEKRAER